MKVAGHKETKDSIIETSNKKMLTIKELYGKYKVKQTDF